MEENKKSGGGDVRAFALSWDGEWDKAENKFSVLSPLSPTVARGARHSHPSPPEKKAASRRKSRLRRKKTAPVGVAWVWALRGGRKILKALKKSAGGRYCLFFADHIWALSTFDNRWGVLFRCRWGAGVWW